MASRIRREGKCGGERRPPRGARFVRAVALVVSASGLLVLVAALGAGCEKSGPPPEERKTQARPAPELHESELKPLYDKAIGEPTAKVKVIAVLPGRSDCRDACGEYLRTVAEKYPAQLAVKLQGMETESGQQTLRAHNVHCASVYFATGDDNPDIVLQGAAFGAQDVRRALEIQFEKAYGDEAPELPAAPEGGQAPQPPDAATSP